MWIGLANAVRCEPGGNDKATREGGFEIEAQELGALGSDLGLREDLLAFQIAFPTIAFLNFI
jgi:hypothetical protein